MRFKDIIVEKIERLTDNVEGLKRSIEKDALTKEQVHESYGKIQHELGQILALLNRENQD